MSTPLDAILGEGDFERSDGPEPSLLPLLTRFASPALLLSAARQAELQASGPLPVPAVARATAAVIARRADRMEKVALYRAAESLPLIVELGALDAVPDTGPELTARIGSRRGDVALVEQAVASAFGGDELVRARAAALPLVGTESDLLQVTQAELTSVSIATLSMVSARLAPESNARLLESWLASARSPTDTLLGLVELLPGLGAERREQAADAALLLVAKGALGSAPPWIVSYLSRRLRETERGSAAAELRQLAESLPSPWHELVRRPGLLARLPDHEALLRSHPSRPEITGPILRGEADRALDLLFDRWGAAKQATYRSAVQEPEPLYLSARVAEKHGTAEVPRVDGFETGRRYRVDVFLAVRELATGIVADVPAPLDRARSQELYISFFAAWLPATPPAPIVIPPSRGVASTSASVEFLVPAGLRRVELTVLLLERIGDDLVPIQGGTLAGDVVEQGAAGAGITLRIDPRPLRPPEPTIDGVTIMLADDALAVYGSPAVDGRFRAPGQLQALRAKLGDEVLSLWAAVGEERDSRKLAASLVQLAASGSRVLELLRKRLDADEETHRRLFQTDGTVRLWSRDLEIDLPVEFIYDGEVPDYKRPALCAGFFDALEAGACRKCEQRQGTICPFDFWAFRRRIERRVTDDRDAASFHRIAEASDKRSLSITAPVAFAASRKVSPESREAVIESLKAKGADPGPPAASWEAWRTQLQGRPHPLLVLLAHTEGGTALEIEGDTIDRQWITEQHVNPLGERPGPLVLLTGCETARPEHAFLSFVSRFLDKGASVVVGTLALIREDASAEATRQVLQALQEVVSSNARVEHRSAGEIMRRARCRLLAKSDLTGLNLVAYGDADWRFDGVAEA